MFDSITAGAYVIRNKKTSTVIHIEKTDVASGAEAELVAFKQDEDTYKNQQIWWIEPLLNHEDSDGPVYSITNPASGKSLEIPPGTGTRPPPHQMCFCGILTVI